MAEAPQSCGLVRFSLQLFPQDLQLPDLEAPIRISAEQLHLKPALGRRAAAATAR